MTVLWLRFWKKVMSPSQIPVMIFCTIFWLKNFLQSATAAISRALSPVKEDVGSSSSWSSGVSPRCEIDRKSSALLLSGLADVGERLSRARNCGRRLDCSSTVGSCGLCSASPCSFVEMSGNSCRQKSTASRSDICVRNLHATISQAFALVSLSLWSSTSRVEKCHFNVLVPYQPRTNPYFGIPTEGH